MNDPITLSEFVQSLVASIMLGLFVYEVRYLKKTVLFERN